MRPPSRTPRPCAIPRAAVAELHAALKRAEAHEDEAHQIRLGGSFIEADRMNAIAAREYQHITARCLVTLLASMTAPERTE